MCRIWAPSATHGVKGYPAREIDGLILFSQAIPRSLKAVFRRPWVHRSAKTKDAAVQSRSCLSLHLHARKPVRHESSIHASQADGIDSGPLPGNNHGENWAEVEYSFSRTEGKSSVGEQVIVDLMRKRGEAKKDFSDHMIRTDFPTQSLKVWVRRDIKQRMLRFWMRGSATAARCRAASQSHLRISFGQGAEFSGIIHAVWPFVTWFTEIFSARTRASSCTSRGRTMLRAPIGQRSLPADPRPARCFGSLRRAHEADDRGARAAHIFSL